MSTLTNDEVLAAFAWPDESICGFVWCPQRNGASYCSECHGIAWSAMMVARERIANGFYTLLSVIAGVRASEGNTR